MLPLAQDNTKTMGSSLTHAKSLTNGKSLGRSGSMLPTAKEDLSYTLGAARRSERRNLRKFVRMCEHMLLNCFREVSVGLPYRMMLPLVKETLPPEMRLHVLTI